MSPVWMYILCGNECFNKISIVNCVDVVIFLSSKHQIFFCADLTAEEQQLLIEIRRKKAQLLHEIQVCLNYLILEPSF